MRITDRPMCTRRPRRAACAWLLLSALVPASAVAEVRESDILADSSITLVEDATFGSYLTLTVTLETRNGQSTLTAVKDGVVTRVALPTTESLGLWKNVLHSGIDRVADAPTGPLPPDQSRFTVSFTTASGTNTFTAYGVDALADTRYREIVREILHVADARAYGKAWQK